MFQWNAGVKKLKTKTEHPLVEFRKRPYGGGPVFSDGFIGGRPFEFRCGGASMRVNVAASEMDILDNNERLTNFIANVDNLSLQLDLDSAVPMRIVRELQENY